MGDRFTIDFRNVPIYLWYNTKIMKKKERVAVAMSGGVDSSVAAALLKNEGYEVIGITMCFNPADFDRSRPACCSRQSIQDVRRVVHKLGIRHYVLNMQKALNKYVIKDFCREYLRGRTPNPCVRCNQYIKFGALLKKARSLDAKYLATGHYARIAKARGLILKKAKDQNKDQSYFLYRLSQNQLKHVLFPLGNYTKEQVRELARRFGLAVAEKRGSQEICFLPGDNYREFLLRQAKAKINPGQVVDKYGNVLGRHKGVCLYTIGQREGLGIARGFPIYITRIDYKKNQLVAGTKEEAAKREFIIKDLHYIRPIPKKKVALKLKLRYNHIEAPVEVSPLNKGLKARFKSAQFAITPGQSAVFYDRDRVLGGGIIERVLD